MPDLSQLSILEPRSSVLKIAHLVYALHTFAIVVGVAGTTTVIGRFLGSVPSIVAVILNYLNRSSTSGKVLYLSSLKELYPRLISHSSLCFGAKEVMSFLGKKLVGQFRGELVSDTTDRCKHRLPGVRIKHRVKMNWIKMYDKAGSVLRVETVINDPEAVKVRRQVRRGRKQVTQWVPSPRRQDAHP